ncbi:MAG: MAPEG family protein [Pseudomonadota bacterium]
MITDNLDALQALGLWTSLNLALMLGLALNTFRWRYKEGVAVGLADSVGLERAVRAHGNNTEYVPGILLGLGVLTLLGETAMLIHAAGALLLVARVLHAIGIQQTHAQVPAARAVGNIVCWLLFLGIVLRLLQRSF